MIESFFEDYLEEMNVAVDFKKLDIKSLGLQLSPGISPEMRVREEWIIIEHEGYCSISYKNPFGIGKEVASGSVSSLLTTLRRRMIKENRIVQESLFEA